MFKRNKKEYKKGGFFSNYPQIQKQKQPVALESVTQAAETYANLKGNDEKQRNECHVPFTSIFFAYVEPIVLIFRRWYMFLNISPYILTNFIDHSIHR